MFVLYVDDSAWQWAVFALAFAFGWLLVRGLFEVGIIVTTSLGGGWFVAEGLSETALDLESGTLLWIGLVSAGIGAAVQTGLWRRTVAKKAT